MLPPRDTTMIPVNWKLRLPTQRFVLLMPVTQKVKKNITVLAPSDCDDHGEMEIIRQ